MWTNQKVLKIILNHFYYTKKVSGLYNDVIHPSPVRLILHRVVRNLECISADSRHKAGDVLNREGPCARPNSLHTTYMLEIPIILQHMSLD